MFLVCLLLLARISSALEYDDIGNFVSTPMNNENYDNILKSKPLVFVKFFTNWFVAFQKYDQFV